MKADVFAIPVGVDEEAVRFRGGVVGAADGCYVVAGCGEEVEVDCADCSGAVEEDSWWVGEHCVGTAFGRSGEVDVGICEEIGCWSRTISVTM